jgi:hypothetical protein
LDGHSKLSMDLFIEHLTHGGGAWPEAWLPSMPYNAPYDAGRVPSRLPPGVARAIEAKYGPGIWDGMAELDRQEAQSAPEQ